LSKRGGARGGAGAPTLSRRLTECEFEIS